MTPTQPNWDRIAQALDGEAVELTDQERQLAEEFSQNEIAIAGSLDVRLPEAALERARNRIHAATASSMWKHVRYAFYTGICAAAMLVISLGTWRLANWWDRMPVRPGWELTYQQTYQLFETPEQQTSAELQALQNTLWSLNGDTNGGQESAESTTVSEDELWRQWLMEGTDSQLQGRRSLSANSNLSVS